MKHAVDMPEVKQCQAAECAYNSELKCHARAITVGDMEEHLCDTMTPAGPHTQRVDIAGVGACRSANCMHNRDLECQAEGIAVTLSGKRAICGTFAAR